MMADTKADRQTTRGIKCGSRSGRPVWQQLNDGPQWAVSSKCRNRRNGTSVTFIVEGLEGLKVYLLDFHQVRNDDNCGSISAIVIDNEDGPRIELTAPHEHNRRVQCVVELVLPAKSVKTF